MPIPGAVPGAATAGRKRKTVQQTFALYDGEIRVAARMKGFRNVLMVLCEHLPAMQDGDVVVLNVPSEHLVGEADVIEHRHIRRLGTSDQHTALVIHIRNDDKEVDGG